MRPSIELASPGEAEVLSLGFAFLLPFIPRFVLRCKLMEITTTQLIFLSVAAVLSGFPKLRLIWEYFPWRCGIRGAPPRVVIWGMPGAVCSVQPQLFPWDVSAQGNQCNFLLLGVFWLAEAFPCHGKSRACRGLLRKEGPQSGTALGCPQLGTWHLPWKGLGQNPMSWAIPDHDSGDSRTVGPFPRGILGAHTLFWRATGLWAPPPCRWISKYSI